MQIAVIGLGSIGQRHARNFAALGCTVRTFDLNGSGTTSTLGAALEGADGAVICTPPASHQALMWEAHWSDARVFVEKPLVLSAAIRSQFPECMVGYQWRYSPELQALKARLPEIGRLLNVRMWYAYDTAGTPQGMATAKAMGPIFDCSHAIDMLRWLLGEVLSVHAFVAGDHADLTLDFGNCQAEVHLGLDSPLECRWRIQGSPGSLTWTRDPAADINRIYVAEAAHFLACIQGETTPMTDGWDALKTVRVCLAAHRSAKEQRWIGL